MARIVISPDVLHAVATAMGQVADDVEWANGRVADDAWALGPGTSAEALHDVAGDLEHQRLLLGRTLDDLARAVYAAGDAYATVDLDAVAGGSTAGAS